MLELDVKEFTYFPSQLCFRTMIDAGERWTFGYHKLKNAIRFIYSNEYRIANDIFGILLTRLHNQTGIVNEFENCVKPPLRLRHFGRI